jgi:nucleoid-associated protein YgaU
MDNERIHEQKPRGSGSWLTILGGCALAATLICSLILLALLFASTAFNLYLAWNLSGYEVSVSQPASTSSALVLVTPTGVLAIIPTPTSTPLPTATREPTSTSTLVPTEAPTNLPSTPPPEMTPETEPAIPTATANRVADAEQGGGGAEEANSPAASPVGVEASTSRGRSQPASETITYVVQEGDTLWLIAQRAYGAGSLWEVIFEENRDILNNADQIQPDQVLRIPLNP